MASLGMKTGFSYLKYPHLYLSLYICSLVSWETTMQDFVRRVHHILLYIRGDFISFFFSTTQNIVFHQWNSFCMVNFQINRRSTLNVIKNKLGCFLLSD